MTSMIPDSSPILFPSEPLQKHKGDMKHEHPHTDVEPVEEAFEPDAAGMKRSELISQRGEVQSEIKHHADIMTSSRDVEARKLATQHHEAAVQRLKMIDAEIAKIDAGADQFNAEQSKTAPNQ